MEEKMTKIYKAKDGNSVSIEKDGVRKSFMIKDFNPETKKSTKNKNFVKEVDKFAGKDFAKKNKLV